MSPDQISLLPFYKHRLEDLKKHVTKEQLATNISQQNSIITKHVLFFFGAASPSYPLSPLESCINPLHLLQLLHAWPRNQSHDPSTWRCQRLQTNQGRDTQNDGWKRLSIWDFPTMVVPNNHGFPTKNDHFGVFWGYHHLRKHPYGHFWYLC